VNFARAKWIALTGVVLAALLAAIALRPAAHQTSGKEGEVVADFAIPRLNAAGWDPQSQDGPQLHRNQPLLLHFWAPSCAPCREELPLWQELATHARDYAVLTVAGDEVEDVIAYLAAHHLTLPVVWDAHGKAHKALGVWGIPHTFAISRTGVIVRDLPGAQTRDALQEALSAAKR